jgi:uncharacterized membrane protein
MTWLVFAFSGPVLWAVSTHFDKFLVKRYFKHSDVAMLLLFTALVGLLTLPFIAYFERTVFAPSAAAILMIIASGVLYMGATLFYLHALQSDEASVVAPSSRRCRCSATRLPMWCSASGFPRCR